MTPRMRRKPVRSPVPREGQADDGSRVRSALPADLLDLVDTLFQVSLRPTPDARAINRGLLPYVTRLASLGPVRDGLEVEVAERQAHQVWEQLEAVFEVDGVETADDVAQSLYDVVMRGLLVGTLVGAGGPEAIRRFFRRYRMDVPVGRPGMRDQAVQAARDRLTGLLRADGYGLGAGEATVARVAATLSARGSMRVSASGEASATARSVALLPYGGRAGCVALSAVSEGVVVSAVPSSDADYGGRRVRRVSINGEPFLCAVDVLSALGYARPGTQTGNLKAAAGPSSVAEVAMAPGGGVARLLFVSEVATVKFIMRSHAASKPGTPQHAFAVAVVERAYVGGDARSLSEAYRERSGVLERALRMSVARNERLASEVREFRRVAARGRKDVAAMQDDMLVKQHEVGRSVDWANLARAAKRDADASQARVDDANRKLADADSRIADLCGQIVGLRAALRSEKRARASEVAALRSALEEKGDIASAALQVLPGATLRAMVLKRGG